MGKMFLLFIIILIIPMLFGCSGNKEILNQKNMRIAVLEERVQSLQNDVK